ncbi:hypothetical protein L3Y34_003611 [Caenorhabditis briggsae]|uniref:Uncharacterized protein n=1 Tax=Caenorhabditis briggsae TaxID=6238 RepID=A0AAE9D635_CAEBR|nr:hypothetical protein L3Y34_003611 [Caenorhabditis briggsae]
MNISSISFYIFLLIGMAGSEILREGSFRNNRKVASGRSRSFSSARRSFNGGFLNSSPSSFRNDVSRGPFQSGTGFRGARSIKPIIYKTSLLPSIRGFNSSKFNKTKFIRNKRQDLPLIRRPSAFLNLYN